ncbi:MAG TPA: alpha-L-arabinofuranosidase C-terminal domain-containing protein [Thermoanaerobaculia bacterium]|jgi:alpha-L-arabinofuranosidase
MTTSLRRFLPRRALVAALLLAATPSPAAAQVTASSRITVDFTRIRRAVPDALFGQNLQAIGRGEGLIRTDGSFDPNIAELLAEARITTLRFPGGTAADYFHWWQAMGPPSRRPLQSSGYVGEYYTPVVGPDEFIKLATALRAVPFVTANSGTGSAEEARALAAAFKSRGFPASYWEIGNEVYFEGLNSNGLVGLPPDVYSRTVIAYASAIRKEMPEAKIFAAAVIGPGDPDSYWNNVVLGLAGPYIDGISVHNAYFPLYGTRPDKTVPPDDELFTSMLGATKVVDGTLTILESQLKRLGRQIPIFVTEYDGIFFPDKTVEDPARTQQRNPTLACALFNASVLNLFLRHERVFGAHHMSLAGTQFGSLVGVDRGVYFRNPQFYVHREYAREAGSLVMEASVDPGDAVFSSNPIALIGGQTNVPMLDAVATRDPAGTRYALFVVNRSLTATVHTAVSLEVPAGLTGTVSVLTGPAAGARNDAENPTRVSLQTGPFAPAASFPFDFPPLSLTIFRWTAPGAAAPSSRPSKPVGSNTVPSAPVSRGSVRHP